MTTSSNNMKRYTTTEYGKQNMFAHEPQVEVLDVQREEPRVKVGVNVSKYLKDNN